MKGYCPVCQSFQPVKRRKGYEMRTTQWKKLKEITIKKYGSVMSWYTCKTCKSHIIIEVKTK